MPRVPTGATALTWPGYLVLGLSTLFLGYLLWTKQASSRMKGHRLEELADLLPDQGRIGGTALVYFHTPACSACKSMTPRVENLRRDHPRVFVVDISTNPEAARRFGLLAMPTTLLARDGLVVEVIVGASRLRQAEAFLGAA